MRIKVTWKAFGNRIEGPQGSAWGRQQDLGPHDPHRGSQRREISLRGALAKRAPFAYLDQCAG